MSKNLEKKLLAEAFDALVNDNDIAKADEFNQNIDGKLDQLIQSMTEIKGEIDNVTVSMLNGEDDMGSSEGGEEDLGDFESDFGEDFGDNMDDDSIEEPTMDGSEIDDFSDNLDTITRKKK